MPSVQTTANGVVWKEQNGSLMPFIDGKNVTWAPQPGSQAAFLECPAYEVLYEGTRGPGKTDALLMDFAQHVGHGYGPDWRGVLFRQTFPELSDVIQKSKKWFKLIWPKAEFNEAKTMWTFPEGEQLMFRQFRVEDDYWSYHGHAYPWIAWEELTTWADAKCYKVMMSCSRSTRPGMPRKYRATTNPYGVGHNWVKTRFGLPCPPGKIFGKLVIEKDDQGNTLPERMAIKGHISENKILLHADPGYIQRIRGAARNESELAAWLDGSWDIVAGGMFDDAWQPKYHVLPDLNANMIPRGWKIVRSYDHGQSKPFSYGLWAVSNGEPITLSFSGTNRKQIIGAIKGDAIRIFEWYGFNGVPNEGKRLTAIEIAQGILERERDWGLVGRVRMGVADSAIFTDYEPGHSVAGDMARMGVRWYPADKGAGSRAQGWMQCRTWLKNSCPPAGGVREFPGLFVCARCDQFLRTFPVLPRDSKNLDDVDTDAEDHIGDEVRYFLRRERMEMTKSKFK
jgi:hypothetical protein